MNNQKAIQVIEDLVDKDIANAIETFVTSSKEDVILSSAKQIATAFGIAKEELDVIHTQQMQDKLIESFGKNLTLLIQKTWVEKSDEVTKAHVLYQLETFCKGFDEMERQDAFELFISIINDAVYLMFGSLTKTNDFCEYAVRVDPGFGVFWCYIDALPQNANWESEKYLYAIDLGMYFLANY